jgi:hypothetical protein
MINQHLINHFSHGPANDLLYHIFFHLTPESLLTCKRVCKLWQQHADESSLYFEFAKILNYFFISKSYFKKDPQKNMLSHYKIVKLAIQSLGMQSKFETFQWVQNHIEGKKIIDHLWEKLLPKKDLFHPIWCAGRINELVDVARFKDAQPHLLFCLQSGILTRKINDARHLFWACILGEIEFLEKAFLFNRPSKEILDKCMIAACFGSYQEIVAFLLKNGANVKVMVARELNLAESLFLQGLFSMGQFLIQNGSNVNSDFLQQIEALHTFDKRGRRRSSTYPTFH